MQSIIQNVTVPADQYWYPTGIKLTAGKKYVITATGRWKDADIECGPCGWHLDQIEEWKRPAFRVAAILRPLDTGDRWFSLIGKVNKEVFEIGDRYMYYPSEDGELLCTANDIQLMYWNNSGALNLTIE